MGLRRTQSLEPLSPTADAELRRSGPEPEPYELLAARASLSVARTGAIYATVEAKPSRARAARRDMIRGVGDFSVVADIFFSVAAYNAYPFRPLDAVSGAADRFDNRQRCLPL